MGKRVVILNESLNQWGSRVLIAGVDISQYQRNPIMLYMHQRGEVVGNVREVRVEGSQITGEPWFDEVSDLSKRLKQQWELDSIRMVSANLDVKQVSSDRENIIEKQLRATVTQCKLMEISIVDMGGLDDALKMTYQGKSLTLASGEDNELLPLLNKANDDLSDDGSPNINNQNLTNMDFKAIALKLGLSESATESEILSKIELLKGMEQANIALKAESDTLKSEKATLQLSGITAQVDAAITAGKLSADKKEHFITLGNQVGVDTLRLTLESMVPAVKPMGVIGGGAAGGTGAGGNMQLSSDWKKLSDVPSDKLLELRSDDKPTYMKLFKAEYGYECKI